MPAYNFKKQFADDVEQGRKTQTIRPKRKRPTVPGDFLRLYTGMRTKECRRLNEGPCVSVEPVEIHVDKVKVAGRYLIYADLERMAWHDGFSTLRAFFDFFKDTYGLTAHKPITDMELIKWQPCFPLSDD